MGDKTGIQWTDHTFNPWIGCQRVSPGCVNCYAEHRNSFVRIQRKQGRELWGPKGDRHITSEGNWAKPLAWNRAAQKHVMRAKVFCASLADVFEDRRDLDAPRARLFALIERTPWLDWQLLTKRADRVADLVPVRWMNEGFPANVWMGTSVENQKYADERITDLLGLPAAVRFLSCEPLLEGVDLFPLDHARTMEPGDDCGIHWVIVGGESGDGARPFDIGWAEEIIEQCRAANVACFVKQLGKEAYEERSTRDGTTSRSLILRDSHGGDWKEWPPHLCVRQFPDSAVAV